MVRLAALIDCVTKCWAYNGPHSRGLWDVRDEKGLEMGMDFILTSSHSYYQSACHSQDESSFFTIVNLKIALPH